MDPIKPVYFHFDRSLGSGPEHKSRAVCFVAHNRLETKIEKTLKNRMEAKIVLDILWDSLCTNAELSGRDIRIIAPDRGQVSLLQSQERQPQKAGHRLIRNETCALNVYKISVQFNLLKIEIHLITINDVIHII